MCASAISRVARARSRRGGAGPPATTPGPAPPPPPAPRAPPPGTPLGATSPPPPQERRTPRRGTGRGAPRLERARATREIADAHIEPLVLEVAESLGQGERQVVQRGLPAHGDVDVPLFKLRVRRPREGKRSEAKEYSGHRDPP